jgi:hypothetical protein
MVAALKRGNKHTQPNAMDVMQVAARAQTRLPPDSKTMTHPQYVTTARTFFPRMRKTAWFQTSHRPKRNLLQPFAIR